MQRPRQAQDADQLTARPVGYSRGRGGQPALKLQSMSDDQVMFTLDESEQVTHWYNIVADLPTPPPRRCTRAPASRSGPDDLAPLFPIELIMQEVSGERYVEIPEPVLDVYQQYRPSPLVPGPPLGAEARHAGPDLLQVRRRLAGRLAQDQHRDPAGLLQLPARRDPADHRDRRRPVGYGARRTPARSSDVECEVWQVGASYDTKPQRRTLIEVFGGTVHRSPSRLTESGKALPRGPPRLARHRDLRGGRGGRAGPGHQVRPRVGAQPRAAAPDRHRRGGAAAAGQGRRDRRRPGRRLRRRRLELRRPGVPVPAREAGRQPEPADPRRRADAPARR